jgi:hypothetical protein
MKFFTLALIFFLSNKHLKNYQSLQTIAQPIAVKNIHLCCFEAFSSAKLEIWKF